MLFNWPFEGHACKDNNSQKTLHKALYFHTSMAFEVILLDSWVNEVRGRKEVKIHLMKGISYKSTFGHMCHYPNGAQ